MELAPAAVSLVEALKVGEAPAEPRRLEETGRYRKAGEAPVEPQLLDAAGRYW